MIAATLCSCTSHVDRQAEMKVWCVIDGANYTLHVRNLTDRALKYWVVPEYPSAFRRVPFGTTVVIKEKSGAVREDELLSIEDRVSIPVRLIPLPPGREVSYSFALGDVFGYAGGVTYLKERSTEFKLRVAVYLDRNLAEAVVAETSWCGYGPGAE